MSYTWNSTSGYYEENGQKARIVYLNFNKLEADKNVPANNVVYTNTTLNIQPTPSKDTAVIMNAIQNLVKIEKGVVVYDKGADICNALNARNVSYYDADGNIVKLVYVNTTDELTEGTYSTIHVGQNNNSKDATISAAVTAGAVSITEVTGNPSTVYAGDTAYAKGFVLTNNAGLSNNDASKWSTSDINTLVSIIDRAGTRLAGIYTCADGTVNSIEDFRDTKAECEKQIIFWEKNPADDTDKGHWIVYEGGEKITKKVIVLDFDGITAADGVTYTNEAIEISGASITGTATVTDATAIQNLIDSLNSSSSNPGVIYISGTSSLSVANGQYSTIYVGDITGTPNADTLKYKSITETTKTASGTQYWQERFGNGFVLTQNCGTSYDALLTNIEKMARHVTGKYFHDEGNDGITLDDFYELDGSFGERWNAEALGGKGAFEVDGEAVRFVYLNFAGGTTTYTNQNGELLSQDPLSRPYRTFTYENMPVTVTATITDTTIQQAICDSLNASAGTFTKTVDGNEYTVKVKYVLSNEGLGDNVSTVYIGKITATTVAASDKGGGRDSYQTSGTPVPHTLTYSYNGISEATGIGSDELFANGFVLTNNSTDQVKVQETISKIAGHLMGYYTHDYGENGLTLDDFYEVNAGANFANGQVDGPSNYGFYSDLSIVGQSRGYILGGSPEVCEESFHGESPYLFDNGFRAGEFVVLNSTFSQNTGAAASDSSFSINQVLRIGRAAVVAIENCQFTDNSCTPIYVDNKCGHTGHNARLTIGGSTFSGNSANDRGSAIFVGIGGSLYMNNTDVVNNAVTGTNTTTDGYGAAIYLTQAGEGDAVAYIEGSTFSGNTATEEGFSRAVYISQNVNSGCDNYLYLDGSEFADKNQRVVSLGQVNMRETNTFAADFYNDGSHTVTFTTETDEDGNSVPAVIKFVNSEEIFVDAKMDTSTGNAQVVLDGCDIVNFGSFDAIGSTYTERQYDEKKKKWVEVTVTVSTPEQALAAKLNDDGTHKSLDEMETLIGGDFDNKFTALDLNEADVIVNQETPFEESAFELGASHIYATGISLHEDVENVYYNGATAATLEEIDELQMMNKKRDITTGESYDFGKLAYVVNYTMMAEAATAFTGTNSIWFNMGKQDLDNKYFVGNNTYQEAFHDRRATIIAGNNKVTNGGSINEGGAEMILEGTLFADEYSFELNNLTWDGSLYGGSKDTLRDDTKGTDLIINGVTFSGTNTQIVGGGQNCGTGTGDINVNINDSKLGSTASIYGAGETTDTNITTGDVNITIKAKNHDNLARIYAGGYANGANIATGDITTTITAEKAARQFGAFYGGALLENGASFNAGTITTTISGGNFLSFVGNGSKTANGSGEVTSTIEETSLAISGGSFANLVYAGGYSNGDGVSVGNSTLIISGGTFAKSVYGGCGANSDANGTKTEITGNVNVTVTATASSAVVFNSNLYAASMGAGQIDGSTYLTVSGDGQYLTFGAASFVTGNSRMGEHIGSTKKVYVTGDRVLTFDGFNGAFGGNMSSGFSKLVFDGSNVSFTGATKVDLQFADTWEFEIGGTDAILTWDSVENSSAFNYNNFSGDTLNLTFDGSFTLASGSEATIIKGCDNTLRNWDKFASVTLNGSDNKLTFDKTENAYLGTVDGSNYKLYVDDTSKSLLLSHLA